MIDRKELIDLLINRGDYIPRDPDRPYAEDFELDHCIGICDQSQTLSQFADELWGAFAVEWDCDMASWYSTDQEEDE